mmetsp:Transcript_2151/g.5729  ORF Transcript_2151/g.5729 Transcript_2151/m.5729 type:complete len:80 (+) Transcript_2151:347-586(+)
MRHRSTGRFGRMRSLVEENEVGARFWFVLIGSVYYCTMHAAHEKRHLLSRQVELTTHTLLEKNKFHKHEIRRQRVSNLR